MSLTKRSFLAGLAFSFATAGAIYAPVADAKTVKYSPATFKALKASGKPFLVGVHAWWCSTCQSQRRTISKLQRSKKALAGITVLEVNWDKKRQPILDQLRIPRRSTLVMFKRGREVGRVVAGVSPRQIERLMRRGL